MTHFLDHCRAEPADTDTFRIDLSDRYNIGRHPNGGYLMAVLASTLGRRLAHPHPLVVTAYYMAAASAGPAQILVEPVTATRSTSTGMARLLQDGTECVRLLGSFTDFAHVRGETHLENGPPELPPFDQCVARTHAAPQHMAVHDTLDWRFADEAAAAPVGRGEITGWVRLADGSEPDPFALLFMIDAFPPAIFGRTGPTGWVPTLEMSVQLRGIPAPGLLRGRFNTRFLTNGLIEEDGELWDSQDRLVALARQMARYRTR